MFFRDEYFSGFDILKNFNKNFSMGEYFSGMNIFRGEYFSGMNIFRVNVRVSHSLLGLVYCTKGG